MFFSRMSHARPDKIGMGHILLELLLNATYLSPLATAKAIGLNIPPTMRRNSQQPEVPCGSLRAKRDGRS
jgi:hypothetical protein